MMYQHLLTSGLKQALHITTVNGDTNCHEMVKQKPLINEYGMFATLQIAVSVMFQMNQFMTHMPPNFDHREHSLPFATNGSEWSSQAQHYLTHHPALYF
jgi:hypothetical protein